MIPPSGSLFFLLVAGNILPNLKNLFELVVEGGNGLRPEPSLLTLDSMGCLLLFEAAENEFPPFRFFVR